MEARELRRGDTVTWTNQVRAVVKDARPDGDGIRVEWEGYPEWSLYKPGEEVTAERPGRKGTAAGESCSHTVKPGKATRPDACPRHAGGRRRDGEVRQPGAGKDPINERPGCGRAVRAAVNG